MKLYLELNMGAAGDMLLAALYELIADKPAFLAKLRALGLLGVIITPERSVKCGIAGTHMRVTVRGEDEISDDAHTHSHSHTKTHDHAHNHTHSHTKTYNLAEILDIIASLNVSNRVKSDASAVYRLLAAAESKVHGGSEDSVHFHEVGALDAVADVVGVCLAVETLGVTEIAASPVTTGHGFVRCLHGVVPVPAPATAELLLGIPSQSGDVRGELCTPTGAALLRRFVTSYGGMNGTPVRIGYGMGSKDFERLNAVRAFLLDGGGRDEIVELTCNLDDMTAEAIGFAADELLQNGALDVFTSPVYMKKNRPATLLTVLCRVPDEEKFTRLMFKHTTTLGVRISHRERAVLDRRTETRVTRYGEVRVKVAEGYGVRREKVEYDDAARLARENGVGLAAIENGELIMENWDDLC